MEPIENEGPNAAIAKNIYSESASLFLLKFEQCIDIELFVGENKETMSDLICPINLGIFNEPVTLPCCGNTLCMPCILQWLEKKKNCPLCFFQANFDVKDIKPSVPLKNQIKRKTVCCKAKKQGCPWSGQLDKLCDHLDKECNYKLDVCKMCGLDILAKTRDFHEKNECQMRKIKCSHCMNEFLAKYLDIHESDCDQVDINCPKCSYVLKRKDLNKHFKTDCLEYPVNCLASSFMSCGQIISRKHMKEHCLAVHGDLLISLTFERLPALVRELETLKVEIAALKELSSLKQEINFLKEKRSSLSDFLTDMDFSIMEKWINPLKNVEFTLLYSAQRNTLSKKVFHERADLKGPTVTVVRTEKNFIIGGYTSLSWKSLPEDKREHDKEAFIFSLSRKEKYKCLDNKVNVLFSENAGPTFCKSFYVFWKNNVTWSFIGDQRTSVFDMSSVKGDVGDSLLGVRNVEEGKDFKYYKFLIKDLEVYSVNTF